MRGIYRTIDRIEDDLNCSRWWLLLLLVVSTAFPGLFLTLLATLVGIGLLGARHDAEGDAP